MEEGNIMCIHCQWKGKHLLHHLKHNQSCMKKTDVEQLRKQVKQEKRIKKTKYDNDHKDKKKAYYQAHKIHKKIYYQSNKEKIKQYYQDHKLEKQQYQKKYDHEHKKERKKRNRFFNEYMCNGGTRSGFRGGLDPASGLQDFETIAAKHIFEHSKGYCKKSDCPAVVYGNTRMGWNGYLVVQKTGRFYTHSSYSQWQSFGCVKWFQEYHKDFKTPTYKTITAHSIDHSVKDELCLSCGSNLIKLYNLNRMQCHECYAAKCFKCKSPVNPNLYESYEHFKIPRFNNFIPTLTCSYFENSENKDLPYSDTCASCQNVDEGLHQIVKDHYSEEEGTFICNEKCPGEFTNICGAALHLASKKDIHPPIVDENYPWCGTKDTRFDEYPYDIRKNQNGEKHLFLKGVLKDKCLCFVNEDDEKTLIDDSKKNKIELEQKMILENGIYKCKFVCRRKFKYPCEMWCHLGYEPTWPWPLRSHWYNPDIEAAHCGMDDPVFDDRVEVEGSDDWKDYLSDAKDWVYEQVKNIITKICCCKEETGLFCDGHSDDCCKKCHNTDPRIPEVVRSNETEESSEEDFASNSASEVSGSNETEESSEDDTVTDSATEESCWTESEDETNFFEDPECQ